MGSRKRIRITSAPTNLQLNCWKEKSRAITMDQSTSRPQSDWSAVAKLKRSVHKQMTANLKELKQCDEVGQNSFITIWKTDNVTKKTITLSHCCKMWFYNYLNHGMYLLSTGLDVVLWKPFSYDCTALSFILVFLILNMNKASNNSLCCSGQRTGLCFFF